MSFTVDHARKLLLHARNSGRMPHALLITGTREAGTHELVLALAKEFNGAVADQPENLRHPMCRILRPGSKSRRILIEDVRAVEPFLALRAEAHETKLVVILEADRMMDEPANAFLKTLEEPPPQTLIVLVTEQPSRLLPTILSRCVRLDLRSSNPGLHLSRVQQLFLPAVCDALALLAITFQHLTFIPRLWCGYITAFAVSSRRCSLHIAHGGNSNIEVHKV